MLQTCLFDDSWSSSTDSTGGGRRLAALNEGSADCAVDIKRSLRSQEQHSQEIKRLKTELQAAYAQDLQRVKQGHAQELKKLEDKNNQNNKKLEDKLDRQHATMTQTNAMHAQELKKLEDKMDRQHATITQTNAMLEQLLNKKLQPPNRPSALGN